MLKEKNQVNNDTFKTIYECYHKLIYAICLKYLKNIEDAEDVTQETFMSICISLKDFNENSTIKTWICNIAVNKCLNILKRNKIRSTNSIDDVFNEEITGKAPPIQRKDHPDEIFINKDLKKMLNKFIFSLSEKQRTAFSMFENDELSYKEIAEKMKISECAVKSLIYEARSNLKKMSLSLK